ARGGSPRAAPWAGSAARQSVRSGRRLRSAARPGTQRKKPTAKRSPHRHRESRTLERNFAAQITPCGIELLNQLDLPCPAPALHRMLARARFEDRAVVFEVDELGHSILARESRHRLRLVVANAANEIVGHADVERTVPLAGEDVDKVSVGHDAILVGFPGRKAARNSVGPGSALVSLAPAGTRGTESCPGRREP